MVGFIRALILIFMVVVFPFVSVSNVTAAEWTEGDCVKDGDVATIGGIRCVVENILGVVIAFIGIGVLVMLVYGGYQFLMSGGDPKGIQGAKGTITYALLGLIIALCSWFIIALIANFTGAEQITNFVIEAP